jgi:heterodisulfide reductase subunit C
MDYGPREIIAALRAGMLDRVLNANAVWLCVSCYSCTVRCPAGIPFTDVMYELKRLEVDKGLAKHAHGATMARAFAETVDTHGRNAETELLRKYYLRTSILKALAQIPLAAKLFFRGRLHLFPRKIKGLPGLRKMMAAISENGSK